MEKTATTEDKFLKSVDREAERMRRSVGAGEQETAIDRLLDAARSGTVEQHKFFSGRKAESLGVGLRDGEIKQESGPAN